MPFDISELTKERKEHVWDYRDEKIHLSWNPNAYTPAFEAELEAMSQTEFQMKTWVKSLLQLELQWDLEQNGKPYKVNEANISALPIRFLADLLLEIKAASEPDESEGKA